MAAGNGAKSGTRVSICVTQSVAPALKSGSASSRLALNATDAHSSGDRESAPLSKLAWRKSSGAGPGGDSTRMNVSPRKRPLYLSGKPFTKSGFLAQYSRTNVSGEIGES